VEIGPYSLPDASDSKDYEVLIKLVDDWIESRDLNVISAGFEATAKRAQSNYVSVMLDPDSTNTDHRRYRRYLAQSERLAEAMGDGTSAKTIHLVADFRSVRTALETLDAGLRFFKAEPEALGDDGNPRRPEAFAAQVIRSFGYEVGQAVEELEGRTVLPIARTDPATQQRAAYLLLFDLVSETSGAPVSLIGHLLEVEAERIPAIAVALVGDFRIDDLETKILAFDPSALERLRTWCADEVYAEAVSQSPYPRMGKFRLRTIPKIKIKNPTTEFRHKFRKISPEFDISSRYIKMPFRGNAVVGFFDLLGFSAFLEERWSTLEEPEKILKQLRSDLVDSGLSAQGGSCFPEVRTISDSIVAFVPATEGTLEVVWAMCTIADLNRKLEYLAARLGFGLRGAVDLGEVYCDSEDVTGPALARCVKLEHFASSMRTIIGPNLLESFAGQMDELTKTGTMTEKVDGKPVTIGVLPPANSLFGTIRQSSDGLWRICHRPDITEMVRALQNEAPTAATKAKYAEYLEIFTGNRIEYTMSRGPPYPSKAALREAAESLRRL